MSLQGRKICLHTKKKNSRFCGNLCHLETCAIKNIYVQEDVCMHVCVCRSTHIPIKWIGEYSWNSWDKTVFQSVHFTLHIIPLFSFCNWLIQHIFKIFWGLASSHGLIMTWSNIHSPQREVFHWRYCLMTVWSGMLIAWLLNGYTYTTLEVTALWFISNWM